MGEAIGYALGNWDALTLFLNHPHLPLDNNASERVLRVAALGRKNFLFVGTDGAGANLASLYSLIATCEANGVNPVAYLADVLLPVQTHPASRIDELLPHRWKPTAPHLSVIASADGPMCGLSAWPRERAPTSTSSRSRWTAQVRRFGGACSSRAA
jgi:transposase